MNIYCVIFMCTFGSNNTDTELASNNSLALRADQKGTDVASMILPGKGEPVPQFGDVVMDLPDNLPKSNNGGGSPPPASSSRNSPSNVRTPPTASAGNGGASPTLSDILLPPSQFRKS